MGYLPGYIATVVVDVIPINDDASDVAYSRSADALSKTPLGISDKVYVNGQLDATLSATLHMSTENAALLNAAFEKTVPVAYTVRPGALGVNDVGQWDGTGIITSLDPSGSATGQWSVGLTIQSTGPVAYTAPV